MEHVHVGRYVLGGESERGSHPPAQSVETQEMSLLQSLGNTLSFPGTLSRMALKH